VTKKKSPFKEEDQIAYPGITITDAEITKAPAPGSKVGADFTYFPPKPPPPLPKPTDPKKMQRKKVQRELALSHQSFPVFLRRVEYYTREEFFATRPDDRNMPSFPEFKAAYGIEVLKDIFSRLQTEFQDRNEIHWFLASRWEGKFSELHTFLIVAGVWKFILLHSEEVKEGNSRATNHQEAKTREADRRTERLEPAVTFRPLLKDYTHIEFNGNQMSLNRSQAQILKYMNEDCREEDVEPQKARKTLTLRTEPWRDLFRHTSLWDTLIIKGEKPRTRRLSVYF